MKPKFLFALIFPFFVGFSIFEGTSSYEWDSEKLANNVQTFAEFMDDLYEDYKEKRKMDIPWLNKSKLYAEKGYSDKQKRTVFNLTFVKCAAEIAHFRVLNQNNDSKDAYLNLKVLTFHEVQYAKNEFIGFLHFDQTLGQQIAEKFKNEIFSKENPKLVHQILQLAFSLAVRIILSIIYAEYFNEKNDIGGWQLKTLLTAFKELSKRRGQSDENGVFPFKIIQIDQRNGEAAHFWAQKFLKKGENLEEDDSEQMIAYEKDNFEESMIEQKCGEDPHKVYDDRQKPFLTDNNTPAKGSNQIEMELFNEPLWNYVRVFGIYTNEAEAVVNFCEDLQTVVQKDVKNLDVNVDKKFKIDPKVKNVTTLKEFKFLHAIIKFVEDKKNSDELEKFSTNYDRKKPSHKKQLLTALLVTLDEIHTDYGNASKREISKIGICLTHSGNEISSFGQILYELMKNLPKNCVKYNENEQLLTIPLLLAKHLLGRLYKFIESNFRKVDQISDGFDFVQTLQTIAWKNKTLEVEKRQKPISAGVNVKLFQLLFALAIRLCFLIDEKELAEKYLPKFVFALKMCSKEIGYTNLEPFEHKMKNDGKNVQINFRNWNLPYLVYKEKEDEFKMEEGEVEVNIRKLNELVNLVKPDDEKVMVNKIVQKLQVLLKLQEKKQKAKEDEAEVEMLREKLWMS
ncbi:hypothetical protein niasHS_013876 [Heterodera schachtii]|uniref:Uncharacterized protein n=1 Tax=Heterodera schachtii TaxID=97005 RepID=A0ABD2IM79_HETSC